MYDPLGFGMVKILPMKVLLQKLCHKNLGWEDSIPAAEKRAMAKLAQTTAKTKLVHFTMIP